MFKIKWKKSKTKITFSLILETARVKKIWLIFLSYFLSPFKFLKEKIILGANLIRVSWQNLKINLSWKIKALQIAGKILASKPEEIAGFNSKQLSLFASKGPKKDFLVPFSSEKAREKIKEFSQLAVFLLILVFFSQICLWLQSFSFPDFVRAQGEKMCSFATDLVLLIDTTYSMDDGAIPSKCQWENLEWVNNEYGGTYMCVYHEENGLTEAECQSRDDGRPQCPYGPVYTPPLPSKIEATKTAAKSFLDKLADSDQSALISFNSNANLVKNLSNDHQATKNAIDSLTPQAGTGTNLAEAINQGNLELSSERGNPNALKVMILLTDGKDANNQNVNEKTQEAANLSYKIFTIGLGNNIDQNQLQNIANTTGGQYHFSASQTQLAGIFDQISQEICQFSSLCQLTDAPGQCVSDGQREHNFTWNYLWCGQNYSQNVEDESCICQLTEIPGQCLNSSQRQYNFSYNFPFCGQKESEIRDDPTCGGGQPQQSLCGNGILEEDEQCDDGSQNGQICTPQYGSSCQYCSNSCQLVRVQGPFCSDGTKDDEEQCDDGNTRDGDGCSAICQIEESGGQTSAGGGEEGEEQQEQEQQEQQGEQEQSEEEEQSGESPSTGGDGGGWIILPETLVTEEETIKANHLEEKSVTISWLTTQFSTSQVIFAAEGESHTLNLEDNAGSPPKYGYAHTTPEYDTDPKVTYHTVKIDGLLPGTTYYFRTISRSSPPNFSKEYSFTTLGEKISLPEEKPQPRKIEEIKEDVIELSQEVEEIGKKLALLRGKEMASKEMPKESLPLVFVEEVPEKENKELVELFPQSSLAEDEEMTPRKESQPTFGREGFLAAIEAISSNLRTLILVLAGLAIFALTFRLFRGKREKTKNKPSP